MLDAKRIQVLVANAFDINVSIQAAGKAQDLIPVSKPLAVGASFILVRSDRPEWASRLQRQLAAEVQSGEWQKMVNAVLPNAAISLTRDGKCQL